jgi:hypothetical protein
MKKIILLSILVFSFSALAEDCTIKTRASMRGYPLAQSFQSQVVEAVDLQDCIDQAKELLGTTYKAPISLPGGLDSAGASGMATFKVKKVKYSFVQDGVLFKGSIK